MTNSEIKSYVSRLVNLAEREAEIKEDRKELFAEIKSQGFDVKVVRQALKVALMDDNKRKDWERERDELDLMLNALGLLADLPLGAAALERAGG